MKFPAYTKPRKNPFHPYINGFICPSFRQSIHQLIAICCKPIKNPCSYGEKNVVNYHENLVKSPTIHTSYIMPFGAPVCALSIQPIHTLRITSVVAPVHASSVQPVCTLCITSVIAPVHALLIQPVHALCIMSVIAPVCASPIPSIHPYNDEYQEFLDGFPGTKYGEKNPSEIMVKFPHDITLTLQQVEFPEETPDTRKGNIPG